MFIYLLALHILSPISTEQQHNSILSNLVLTQLCHPKPAMRRDALFRIKEFLTNSEMEEKVIESWSILLPGIFSRCCDPENWIRSFIINLIISKSLLQTNQVSFVSFYFIP